MRIALAFCTVTCFSIAIAQEALPPSTRRDSDKLAGYEDLSISRFQAIGTHNSYHIAPGPLARSLIAITGEARARSLEYSRAPLSQQLDAGLRQIELDLFPDPDGGRFANPAIFALAHTGENDQLPRPEPIEDPDNLMHEPSTKVLHFPDFDFRTNVLTLVQAMRQIGAWSQNNAEHFPILVLLELKATWDDGMIRALEQEILSAVPRKQLLAPDDVRGEHPDLRTAILSNGWPHLSDARGRIILALDNTGRVRETYLREDPRVVGRLLFPSCPSDQHPSAAWFKLNDPVGSFDQIRRLTKAGFLVRTRADADTVEARSNDVARREKAFASGAQYISTDFPFAVPKFSGYKVQFSSEHTPFLRVNPR